MEETILQENCPLSAMWCKILIYVISIGAGMEFLTSIINIDEDTYKLIVEDIESSYWNFLNKKKIIEYFVYFLPKWVGPLTCKIGEIIMLYCLMIAASSLPKTLTTSITMLIISIGVSSYFVIYNDGINKLDTNYLIQFVLFMYIGAKFSYLYKGKIRILGISFIVYSILSFIFHYSSLNNPIFVYSIINVYLSLKLSLIPVFYDIIRRTIAPE